jgi:release factor glutamine methyltransferase
MTLREVIQSAAARLSEISDTARLDAELIAAHALGTSRETLLLQYLDSETPAGFDELVARREQGEPIAYIVGHRDFWTIRLQVAPGVLIPRPDSETLIEAAVAHFGWEGPKRVLDLGTGSGALLLAALDQWPTATGLGVDRSELAVEIARGNVTQLGMEDRARIVLSDWDERVEGRFELILCNPPYIADEDVLPVSVSQYEPATALFAGPDGLADYLRLAPGIERLLAPGGLALFEIGASQGIAVSDIFSTLGYRTRIIKDLAARDRCVVVEA